MFKSLFTRLSLSFFITLLAISLIIITVLNLLLIEEPKRQFSEKLLRYMVSDMGNPPLPSKLKKFTDELGIALSIKGINNYHWESKQGLIQPQILEKLTTTETNFEFLRVGTLGQVILLRQGDYSYYISEFHANLSTKAKITLIIGLFALLLIFFLNYRFIHWLFHPIKQLQSDVKKISEGDTNHHLITSRKDELGELIQSVNSMTEILRKNISSKRELLLAISHELRTPLARAKMHLELMSDNITNNKYQLKLDNNLNEINTLIEALLQSEGLNNSQQVLNHSVLNLEQIDLNLLIQQVVNEYDTSRIELNLANNHCQLEADEIRIKLLISNLISNALQYSDGLINISLKCNIGSIECKICDHGEGIAAKDIPKLTEAFYRPDKSRQRKTGSHGLGLYLCQKIVDAHIGEIQIKSEIGKGTCVSVTLKKRLRTQD